MKMIQWMLGSFCLLFTFWAFVIPDNTASTTTVLSPEFKKFIDYFPAKELPFEMDLASMLPDELEEEIKREQKKSLNTSEAHKARRNKADIMAAYLPDANQRRFSRMGPPEIMAIQSFETKDKLIAVIFEMEHRFHIHSKQVKLALFSRKGQLQSEQLIASYNPQLVKTCKIDREGILELTTYTNEWEKELEEFGPMDNSIVACHQDKVEFYTISKKGKIENLQEYPTKERASLH